MGHRAQAAGFAISFFMPCEEAESVAANESDLMDFLERMLMDFTDDLCILHEE